LESGNSNKIFIILSSLTNGRYLTVGLVVGGRRVVGGLRSIEFCMYLALRCKAAAGPIERPTTLVVGSTESRRSGRLKLSPGGMCLV
jgi:hypothetical protein